MWLLFMCLVLEHEIKGWQSGVEDGNDVGEEEWTETWEAEAEATRKDKNLHETFSPNQHSHLSNGGILQEEPMRAITE